MLDPHGATDAHDPSVTPNITLWSHMVPSCMNRQSDLGGPCSPSLRALCSPTRRISSVGFRPLPGPHEACSSTLAGAWQVLCGPRPFPPSLFCCYVIMQLWVVLLGVSLLHPGKPLRAHSAYFQNSGVRVGTWGLDAVASLSMVLTCPPWPPVALLAPHGLPVLFIHVHTCMWVIGIYTSTHMSMRLYVCICTRVNSNMHVHIHVCA